MTDDPTLLRRYAAEHSEAAFAELVRRHLPMVYSAALRRFGGDVHRAEDVAQAVFCALAREASRLAQHPVLTGWLYTATRNAVLDTIRAETRRRAREEEAHTMQETASDPARSADWFQLRPVLDAAMDELSGDDREAVLLRFFQARPFAEIGTALGLSEDTARKRVERALDKLRTVLSRRGIASTSAALATLLAGETIAAAPAGLAASVTGAALAAGGATITGLAAFFAMTKLQAGIAAVVLVVGAVGLITQQRTISALRESAAEMEQQRTKLAAENMALAKARAAADAEVAKLRTESAAVEKTAAAAKRRAAAGAALAARNESLSTPLPDTPETRQRKDYYHRRYDPFFSQRNLTPAQADRLIELWIHQERAREDLQASVQATNLSGDTPGIEELRSKLYAPITREVREILGAEGYAVFEDYEMSSYFRLAFVDPMLPAFSAANVPLASEQIEKLSRIVGANDHPVRLNPTDIGSHSRIDWPTVVSQASPVLTPAQLAALQTYADRHQSGR